MVKRKFAFILVNEGVAGAGYGNRDAQTTRNAPAHRCLAGAKAAAERQYRARSQEPSYPFAQSLRFGDTGADKAFQGKAPLLSRSLIKCLSLVTNGITG